MSLKEKTVLLWKSIFGKKEAEESLHETEEGTERPLFAFRRDKVNIHSRVERELYVRNCLEQLGDAEKELHRLEYEYNKVTSHLTDIEELERSPEEMREEIRKAAGKLDVLKVTQEEYKRKKKRISDTDFTRMDAMEADVEDGIKKLQEAEGYQKLVKNDMKRLHDELHAYEYRRDELEQELRNASGIAVICFVALVICLTVLFALQITLQFDTRIGYGLVIFIAAAVILRLFLRHGDAGEEIVRVEKDINRLILLQNTVKIRYVNNKNLLDYLCMKFRVKKAAELQFLWERYKEEKEEQERIAKATKDYNYYQIAYLRLLREVRIKDTGVWLHRIGAVLKESEMTELRQGLVRRRKSLREQMDYNRQLAASAQQEVATIGGKNPRYKEEILELIAEYEKKQEAKSARKRKR